MTSSREESSHDDPEEEFEEPLPPPRRKTRGINKKLKEDASREIEFNEFSLPVGKTYPTFSSQVGISTRNHVNIKYKTWPSVPPEVKDRLWHEIRRDYNLPDDPKKKTKIMQQCSNAFKRFKTRLRKKFMDLGRDPCSVYESIEKSDWEAFLAIEAADERKSKREEGRENALKKKIQTHLGRKGYRGFEEAWAKEAERGGLVGEIHKLFDPRARRFLLARVVKDKKGGYLPIPLSSYFDELVQLEGQLEAGHLSLPPGKDLLWYVIGSEHGGRTRGVGYTVGIREGIHDYKETRKRMTKEQIRDETITSLTERVQTVEGVVAVISKCQTNMPEGASDSAMMRSCGSPMFSSNDTQVGNGVEEYHKSCHQCGEKGKNDVIDCEKCRSNRYCVDCKTEWYPDISEEEFVKACPVCCNNCNCNTCLHGFSPELLQVIQGYSCSEPDKIQYSKQLLQKVFPLLKNLNEESQIENEMEAKLKGSSLSDVKFQNAEFKVADDITCDNCRAFPSAKGIQGQDMKHFQWHWSKGEPIIVSDVLSTSSGLSWEPMVLRRAFSGISKSGNHPRAYKVNTVDCLNGRKVDVYLYEFLRRYSEGGFDREEGPRLLKLENWQPPCLSQGEWPRHFAEFISCLPFKEYTHPHNGYFNVAAKLPDVSLELDMGPRMDIAYGVEEELKYGDSVTKLHYDKSDTVNVLTHAKSAPHLSAKFNKKKMGKRKHGDQDGASVSEEGLPTNMYQQRVADSMVEGALWDIFQRQDVTKLKKYLWNHSADFKLADCPSAEKDFFPIHDSSFYLNMEHKRKLKEEFGIEPWTFKQKLGDAVLIPAGCPYQVRNLKSCTKVELNFISPESLGACILLQKELRMLPNNHKAKQQMQNIGKMMICALKRALMDLSSNGPIDDLQFANIPDIINVADDGANICNHGNGWLDDSESEAISSDDLGQEKFPNEVIALSSSGYQNEPPPSHNTDHVVDQEPASFEDSNETEGMYRGNAVGVAEKMLLQAFELHYPNAFEWGKIGSGAFWPEILKELYTLIKGILETSVEELVEEEQITKLEKQLSGLNAVGFNLSWIEKRLDMVKQLYFGDYPFSQELMVLQQSVEPLKEEMNERQRQYIEAQELFEKARIKYDTAKKARNKLHEMTQKYGDELVLTGPLGSGMLPGY